MTSKTQIFCLEFEFVYFSTDNKAQALYLHRSLNMCFFQEVVQ